MFQVSNFKFQENKGFTFVEVLVGTAILLVVFIGLYGAFQLGLKVVGQSRARVTATALANQKIEIAKNLPYNQVGTIGGIPSGSIPETEIITRNNIDYTVKTTIGYVDDPFDGLAPDDSLPNDYKRVKVKVSWPGFLGGEIILITDIAPKGLETTEGGGNLLISVFDALGIGVAQADIHIVNTSVDPPIDVSYQTNDQGQYLVAGAPTSTEAYQITVTKSGYSTDRTYGREEVANPEKPHATVLEGKLTEISFSIDWLSNFSISTLSPWGSDNFADSFLDESKISELSNLTVSGGEVNLTYTQGVEFTDGTTDGDLCAFPGIDGDCGQSFTMGSQSKEISQVQLYLRKTSPDISDIYLEIREGSTIGTVLATSSIMTAADLPDSLDWVTFALQSPVTLAANTQYFLRLRSIPDSTDPETGAVGYIYWGYIHATTSPPAYEGGDAWRYIGRNNNPDDPGQQLGPDDQYDFSFRIYQSVYTPAGYLFSVPIAPTDLVKWDEFSWNDNEPAETQITYQLYYSTNTDWWLIPDSDLPGNEAGFTSSPIDLSGLATTTYYQLKIKGNFSTTDTSVTPTLFDWSVSWITNQPTPIGNVSFNLQGNKIIGTDANEDPIYKYSADFTTDATGRLEIANLEWDAYDFTIDPAENLDLASTSPPSNPLGQDIDLLPGTTQSVSLFLEAENSLLITLRNSETLEPIFSGQVRLSNSGLGYDQTQFTDQQGQTLFIPLEAATYNLDIQTDGYGSYSGTVEVSGDETLTIDLIPTGPS
jgi:hypothetical protein